MQYSRRKFARVLEQAAVVLATGIGPQALAALAAPAPFLTRALFLPHVGTEFRILTALGPRVLKLVAAEEVRLRSRIPQPAGIERTCLRFLIDGEELAARTWLLRHPGLGEIPLFLSPGLRGRCHANLVSMPAELFASCPIPRPDLTIPVSTT